MPLSPAIPAGAEVAETELDETGSFVDITANLASFDLFLVNGESVSFPGGSEGSSLVLSEVESESSAGIAPLSQKKII